ncbi:phytanoyl-CoA dioxygenase family protein [Parasphingopyxis algicola]|uniref:phytanoyl-CoA dioxygenase family protein n=1 Tax=Parasphingopyxis algicola TaxID=2026624 RepID=UPI0015A45A18|nr:phytanoyl-CoA dioxygenase family protein [Parasphingopyxis algicola]QLC26363.1 phytanoyl-CoA dioxygenase family protein [Parasphingopyxis algicola]
MAFNRSPLRDVTQEDIDNYERDGAVVLRDVFDTDWMDLLEPFVRRMKIDEEDFGLLPHSPSKYLSHVIPEFRRFVFDSPLGEVSGKLLRSKEIRYFFEEVFAKPPKTDRVTMWHNDRMGWPVTGGMVPSLWIPLTPIVKSNSLEVVAGSHKTYGAKHWIFSRNAQQMIKPDDRPTHPDMEPHRGDPNYTFLSWEMNRGDMLVVHPWTLHYSGGNPTDDWRIAVSARVFGDDIRWDPRPDANNLAGVSFDEMIPGEKPMGSHFPLLWSEDGRRDDASRYPRGFATEWSKEAVRRLKEESRRRFDKMKELEKAGKLGEQDKVPQT